MKAITLIDNNAENPTAWASLVEAGLKTIETRKWPVPKDYAFPFDLLICASKSSRTDNAGLATCVVTVVSSHPMRPDHEERACCPVYEGAWAWGLTNLRWLSEKFAVVGHQRFYEVDIPESITLREPTADEIKRLRQSLLAEGLIEEDQL